MNIKILKLLQKEPKFRLLQIEDAYYSKSIINADNITTLSLSLRDEIKNAGNLCSLKLTLKQISKDGTIKCLFNLQDDKVIESVLMKYKHKSGKIRNTLCISSQAGCGMRCSFCATGALGLLRNLSSDEIVDQVVYFNHLLNTHEKSQVHNIVFMGMGEPFNNYESVISAIKIINEKIGIGARHITVSTCGIVPNIYKFADLSLQVNLAISLHSPYDIQRSNIMPINDAFKIQDVLESVKYYIEKTHRRVSFEYIMLGDENDSIDTAEDLGHLLEPLKLVHVNLIPYNPVYTSEATKAYKQSSNNQIHRFAEKLEECGVATTIRHNKGRDIDGACGQLAGKSL